MTELNLISNMLKISFLVLCFSKLFRTEISLPVVLSEQTIILAGNCVTNVTAVQNFTVERFAGTWYEVARYPSELQSGECAATQYVINGQNSFNITNSIVRNERQYSTFIPSATVSTDGRAIISATVTGVSIDRIYILATDYSEYALTYACRNINAFSKQIYSWKLSRSRAGLSVAANTAIDRVVSDNVDLFQGYYSSTRQTNDACFHYPVFDQLPGYITLPGSCDETIRGVANFNTALYMGRWMEVARYPQPTQLGQCNRAYYTLSNNVINIENTQVTNQVLSTREGTAVIVSNDGAALLNVTFNLASGPESANYYVLATDYTSYSLVYSCRNLANGNRQVGSWKLSRTPTLSNQANNIMDAVINSTQGLLADYYRTTNQSEADCFFIPELTPNEAIIFRGQCENITGVGNFTPNLFLGWWHEIERYPSSGNIGECISSRYALPSMQIIFEDISVINNNASVATGSLVTSIDGRLRRTFANGQVQDIWVLATDYNSYALLYTCENVGDEFKRVWSAKHSKTRQLTQAAQNIMAQTINASDVLYERFYLPVNQSDATCFHYPAQTGDRVIIPGQCDQNIPVVQNFDVNAYSGTWYHIERYDQVPANITCAGERYTVAASNGTFDIINWVMNAGTLQTTNGFATTLSTDGSGRLIVSVTTGSSSVAFNLYVLRTDYQNYALTYFCQNINSYQRAVRAWKLSRTRTMSSVGTTVINEFMTQRPELHQPYFKAVVQNAQCQEPSSAFLATSSILMVLIGVVLQSVLL